MRTRRRRDDREVGNDAGPPGRRPPGTTADAVLQLQRDAGNKAVSGWVGIGAGNKGVSSASSTGFATAEEEAPEMPASTRRAVGAGDVIEPFGGFGDSEGAQGSAGDGHDLVSDRFRGIDLLERVFDDQARLGPGFSGESTRRVQQALIDLGSDLGPAGADGIYGQKTAAAVQKFKADQNLGSEQFGDVGPGTIGRLDQIFGGGGNVPPVIPPVVPPTPGETAITSQTLRQAPDGTDSTTRRNVGPGEQVRLRAAARSTWAVSSGKLSAKVGSTVVWTAGAAGGAVTITATPTSAAAGTTGTATFAVVPPDALDMTQRTVVGGFPATTAGAAMTTNISFGHPEVNFSRCQWLEVPGPDSGRNGYFAKRKNFDFLHHPNASFITMANPGGDIRVIDNCSSGHHPKSAKLPFEAGGWVWNIPNKYRAIGSPEQIEFITTQQVFVMSGPDGTVSVEKQGAFVERTPSP